MSARNPGVSPGHILFDCPCCGMPDVEILRTQAGPVLRKTDMVRPLFYSKDPRAVKARALIREILKERKAKATGTP